MAQSAPKPTPASRLRALIDAPDIDGATEPFRPDGLNDVLVRETVEPVASDPRVPEPTRERKTLRHLRHTPMEGGIEAGDLGKTGKARGNRLDTFDRRRQVERSEGNQAPKAGDEPGVDALRGGVRRSAVDHAMADRGGPAKMKRFECREHRVHGRPRFVEVANGIGEGPPRCVADPEASPRRSDLLDGP